MEATASLLTALPALAVPLTFALAGLAAPRRAELAGVVAASAAALHAVAASSTGETSALGVRFDVLTRVLLLLVTFLGSVIVHYSRSYLDGEPGRDRYHRWLLLTLAAVTVLVSSGSLLVIALAWTATSIALHQLLTFYSNRQAALVAAHKKFLVSRLADGALGVSLCLLYADVGSFDLDRITTWIDQQRQMPISMDVAACLLVTAVALRSAQLPFHGWITQVMEAPTPVSALLHAGVVNIGGFVLIRLASWVSHSEPAMILLVSIGLVTATVSALVMTTRVSVKVALAWSTCAQMGFMLVQCGLGLWALALLHLVAHSLYKAHAFLSAGAAVDDWRVGRYASKRPSPSPARVGVSMLVSLGIAFLVLAVMGPHIGLTPLPGLPAAVMTALLGLSLVALMNAYPLERAGGMLAMIGRVLGVLALYAGWHVVAEHFLPARQTATSPVGWLLTGLGFSALFALKSVLHWRPSGSVARRVHHWLFAGLYLDELFTRMTFRFWPPRLAPPERTAGPASDARVAVALPAQVRS